MSTALRYRFALIAPLALLLSFVSPGLATTALAETVARGEWTTKENRIRGGWKIERTDNGVFLVLDDGFRTRNAPDLKFMLTTDRLGNLNNRNAMANATLIAPLRDNRGAQRYRLPAAAVAALDDAENPARTILLHCEQYTKLWGGATIQR